MECLEEIQHRESCAVREKAREEKRARQGLRGRTKKFGLLILMAIRSHQKVELKILTDRILKY